MSRILLRAAALALTLCAGAAAAETPDPVVATLDGMEIRRSEVERARNLLPAQYRKMPFERVFEPLLERIINIRLAAKAGRAENLHDDKKVQEQVARFEDRLIEQAYLDRRIAAAVTDEAVKSRYEDGAKDFEAEDEVRARHILVKTEKEAKAIIAELDGGADFAALAGRKSTGPSKAQGGDLGYFTRERMVKPFSDAAFALETGGYTPEPVESQFGWHVIKLEERRKTERPAFEKQEESLRDAMAQEVITRIFTELRKDTAIVRFEANGAPRKADGAPRKTDSAPGKDDSVRRKDDLGAKSD